jgi:phasin family protein
MDTAQTFTAGKKAFETGAQAFRNTVDQFSGASNQAFKEGVDKSLAALNEMNAQSKRNIEAVSASVTAATKGVETLGAQAINFSKKAFDDHVAQTKALTGARSVQEVVELQTGYAKVAIESYIAELNRASETVSAAVKDCLRPLNERVSAVVEQVQAAR